MDIKDIINNRILSEKEAKSLLNKYDLTEEDRIKWSKLFGQLKTNANEAPIVIDLTHPTLIELMMNTPSITANKAWVNLAEIPLNGQRGGNIGIEDKDKFREILKVLLWYCIYSYLDNTSGAPLFQTLIGKINFFGMNDKSFCQFSRIGSNTDLPFIIPEELAKELESTNTRSSYMQQPQVSFIFKMSAKMMLGNTRAIYVNHNIIGIKLNIVFDIMSAVQVFSALMNKKFDLANKLIDYVWFNINHDIYQLKPSTMNISTLNITLNYTLNALEAYDLYNNVAKINYNGYYNLVPVSVDSTYDEASNSINGTWYFSGPSGLKSFIITNNVITEIITE